MPFAQTDGGFTAIHSEARVNLGECQMDRNTNNYWAYVKASEDLTEGQAVSPSLSVDTISAGDISTADEGSNKITEGNSLSNAIKGIDLKTSERYHENLEIVITAGTTGAGQVGVVLRIDNFLAGNVGYDIFWQTSDDGKLATALDNTTTAAAFHAPWYVKKATANYPVVGFVQQDVEKHQYFWVLCKGKGLGLRSDHSTHATAVAVGDPLAIGGTNHANTLRKAAANDIGNAVATSEIAAAATKGPAVFPITANADYPISVVMPKMLWQEST